MSLKRVLVFCGAFPLLVLLGAVPGYFIGLRLKAQPAPAPAPVLAPKFMPSPSIVKGDLADPQPKFSAKREYDFGVVATPFTGTATWVLSNTGNAPLTVKTVKVSCGCTTSGLPVGESVEILPGKTYEYTAKLNLNAEAYESVRRLVQLKTSDPGNEDVELVLTAAPKGSPEELAAKKAKSDEIKEMLMKHGKSVGGGVKALTGKDLKQIKSKENAK